MVAHVYNPRYLGGRDQEDHSLRLASLKEQERAHLNSNSNNNNNNNKNWA
jgi:hypothetical protein